MIQDRKVSMQRMDFPMNFVSNVENWKANFQPNANSEPIKGILQKDVLKQYIYVTFHKFIKFGKN
jgi:hypothetical protein